MIEWEIVMHFLYFSYCRCPTILVQTGVVMLDVAYKCSNT